MRLFGARRVQPEVGPFGALECPYCKKASGYEIGATPTAFGYPSARFDCCGKVAFLFRNPATGEVVEVHKIGRGQAMFVTVDDFWALRRRRREEKLAARRQRAEARANAKAPGVASGPTAGPIVTDSKQSPVNP
jgi:hypothetical protein